MRALVTGGNGFVGRHLTRELRSRGHETIVAGHHPPGGVYDVSLDLGDVRSIAAALDSAAPDVVFHLAAQAFVPRATQAPLETYDVNIMGTARLIEAIRTRAVDARPKLVFASSSETYGRQAADVMPLRESVPAAPQTVYAASKLAGEAIVLASARTYGFAAIVTRAFNHIGPGQDERYAVAGFARRLAAIAAGGPALFPVGNLETQRDFLDVRDVVRAYVDLAERGESGNIYNVCSGIATRMKDVLRQLVMIARVALEIREDPALMRPVDVPVLVGDNAKLRAATGWAPEYALARSLRDIYDDARAVLAANQ